MAIWWKVFSSTLNFHQKEVVSIYRIYNVENFSSSSSVNMNLVEVFVINCLGTLLNKMYLRKSSTSSIQNQIIRLALIRIESVYRLKTEIKDTLS